MSIEAMKQALEALEYTTNLSRFLLNNEANIGPMLKADEAIASLRQAIAEAEKDEPVARVTGVYGGRFVVEPLNPAMVLPVNMALYASPQPRKPLTDEELDLICEKALFCRVSFQQFARSIEAAHGINYQEGEADKNIQS